MSQVQQIKDATSIVEVIGERINLNLSGTHYRGLCPFHGEKSPSFFVNESLGIYKCFGCQAGGDVINFLQEYEGMTFIEAMEYLAERAGIKLEKRNKDPYDKEHEIILTILNDAADYFQLVLKHEIAGKKARDYLKDRNLTNDSLRTFRIGATSDSWDGLLRYLTQRKNYKPDEIIKTGMILRSKNGKYFDRFRSRIMFPLKNHRGQIVGFSGRIINSQDPKEAKYINTPETSVYHKSKLFYGLNENMSAIKKEKAVIVVEGEFDMISSVEAYVKNVVAIKGSALTEDHAKMIKRYVQKVYLALDMDNAGIEATKKAARALEKEDIALRVILLPEGKDPDELAKNHPQVWREAVKSSISIYDFFLQALRKKYDINSIEGKKQFIKEIAPLLNQINNKVEQDHYLVKLASLLQIRKEAATQDINRYVQLEKSGLRNNKIKTELETTADIQNLPSKDKSKIRKENYLIFLTLNLEQNSLRPKIKLLADADINWESKIVEELIEKIIDFKPEFSLEKFNNFLTPELKEKLGEIYLNPEFSAHSERIDFEIEWVSLWKEIQNENIRQKLQKLNTELEMIEIKDANDSETEIKQEVILKEILNLQKKLRL